MPKTSAAAEASPAPAELRSTPLGGETTTVDVAGAPSRDLFYVRSPVTGDVRGVPREQAGQLIFRSGWEPVVEPATVRLLQRQLLRESASPWAAAAYGAARGLTGGLSEFALPQGQEPGAMALQAIREEHPYISTGAEIAGTVAPFLAPLRGLKLLTVPGMAEAAGAKLTRAVAGESPGIARAIAARSAGMAFEGGTQGSVYNAGESAIDDTPLTAQKLVSGFLMGATPGAILGAPVGAAEGILGRYGLRGKLARENIIRPGVDDADLMRIAQREHGVAVPGLGDELAGNMAGVSPELVKMADDPGAFGQGIRDELVRAPELKRKAYESAAEALNHLRDMDEAAVNGVAGRMKEEQVRRWIPAGHGSVALPDAEAAIAEALRADAPEVTARREAATVAPGGVVDEQSGVKSTPAAVQEFGSFAEAHPAKQEMLGFLNEERRAASRYERQRTAGLAGLGIEGDRAGEIKRIQSTMHGAQRFLNDAVDAGHGQRGVFYRGERMPAEAFNALKAGDEFSNPNIWSLAQTDEHAASFAKKKLQAGQVPVLFEVETPAAINADAVPGSNTFEEMLLPRARKMRIAGIEQRDGLNVVKLTDAPPDPREQLRALRARAEQVTGRFERQQIEDQIREVSKNIPVKKYAEPRGAVASIDFTPADRAELDRQARANRMAGLLISWMDDSPQAAYAMRRELAAGSNSGSLRKAIRRALANGDAGFVEQFGRVYNEAGEEGQRALGKRLLNAGHAPSLKQAAESWRSNAIDLLDELGAEAGQMGMQPRGVVGKKPGAAAQISDLITDAREKILRGDKAQAFIELDYLKKRLAKFANPGEYLGADENIAAMARGQYESLRDTLENPHAWGQKAAIAQQDINRIFTKRINRADAFFNKFYVDSGEAHPENPWIRSRRATPDSVEKQLAGVVDPEKSPEHQAFKQHIAESRDVLANLEKHYALSPQESASLGKWRSAVDDAERSFGEASYFARRESQAKALFSNQAKLIPGWGKWVAMHFLGPVGFLSVAAAERASNPGQRIYMRAVLERTLRNSDSRIAGAVTRLLTGKSPRFEGVGFTQLAAKAAVSMAGEKPEKKRETYKSTIRELTEMADPAAATKHAAEAMPFAVATLPQAPAFMGSMMSKASQYLLSHAPTQPRWTPYGTVVDQPSDSALHEFEARMRGAMDPVSVFEDAAHDRPVPSAQIEAAEFVAPDLMDHVRLLALDEITNGGHKLSYRQAITVSRVIGIPLDPTFEPGYINAQQMVYASRAKAMPPPSASRGSGEESGVNKEYRSLNQSKDDKIEEGIPPS